MIWVVVMDGGQARIFTGEKKYGPIRQILSLEHTHEATHNHGRDKPGRSFSSAGTVRHAYEKQTDWHEHQKEIFEHQLAHVIIKGLHDHKFTTLYLVCPPKMTGLIRHELSASLSELELLHLEIIEVHKDLSHFSKEKIEEHIKKAVE